MSTEANIRHRYSRLMSMLRAKEIAACGNHRNLLLSTTGAMTATIRQTLQWFAVRKERLAKRLKRELVWPGTLIVFQRNQRKQAELAKAAKTTQGVTGGTVDNGSQKSNRNRARRLRSGVSS